MKKIGLAVCYDTKNYGSQLQVLATIKYIESMGFDAEIIRYKKTITPHFIIQTIPRLFNLSFVLSKIRSNDKYKKLKKYPEVIKKVEVRNKNFKVFVEKYFANVLVSYNGWEKLVKESAVRYDYFLCGSDQLWLPNNLGSHFYTLEFAPDNKPKIAYATSFGVSMIPRRQWKATRRYLARFQALSTREPAGQKIIKDVAGLTAKVVCDPTLLFNREEWEDIIPKKKIINYKYIFCYYLGMNENHRKIAEELSAETHLPIVSCPFLDDFVECDLNFGDKQVFDVDAADFVNLIRNAEFILTDSFHGSVFSIIHHKKFLTFDRFLNGPNSRNGRIEGLFHILGLSARRYDGDVSKIYVEIDYKLIDKKLCDLRNDSIGYLSDALEVKRGIDKTYDKHC